LKKITEATAKKLLKEYFTNPSNFPHPWSHSKLIDIITERSLWMIDERVVLEPIIDDVLQQHPNETAKYKAGKTALLGFFIGCVMKATNDCAQPEETKALLLEKLDKIREYSLAEVCHVAKITLKAEP